ncbi:MAG: HYR domain-containing protein [Actinomycetota bacterium]|nr:HYR domain-containing protein [Actinomycetota bacterium]
MLRFSSRSVGGTQLIARVAFTTLLTGALAFAGLTPASADTIQNTVVAGGSPTVMVGDTTSIGYSIQNVNNNGGDPQNNCNAADATSPRLTVTAPAAVTVSPASRTFTSCGSSQYFDFSSNTAGSYSITVSVADAGTGTYTTSGATFTLTVTRPLVVNTAPSVAISNVTNGASYEFGNVPVARCNVIDKEDGNTFTVKVQDTLAPNLTVSANKTAVATSANGAVVSYTAPTATDIVDGSVAASCDKASGSVFALGSTTVTCTAKDAAGNTGAKSFTVTVTAAWSNVLQPINADGSSIFKLGSTVPVKFQLSGASAGITNLSARLYLQRVGAGATGTTLEAISTSNATTGNLFRYDATSGQYIFNLNTKALSAGTYQLRIDLGDGVLRTVNISLR